MTAFFYNMPIWLSTLLVLGLAVAIGLGSSVGLRAFFRLKTTNDEQEIAVNLMQVVAAYIGIMLAFSGVAVWQNFADAESGGASRGCQCGRTLPRPDQSTGPKPIRHAGN